MPFRRLSRGQGCLMGFSLDILGGLVAVKSWWEAHCLERVHAQLPEGAARVVCDRAKWVPRRVGCPGS